LSNFRVIGIATFIYTSSRNKNYSEVLWQNIDKSINLQCRKNQDHQKLVSSSGGKRKKPLDIANQSNSYFSEIVPKLSKKNI